MQALEGRGLIGCPLERGTPRNLVFLDQRWLEPKLQPNLKKDKMGGGAGAEAPATAFERWVFFDDSNNYLLQPAGACIQV